MTPILGNSSLPETSIKSVLISGASIAGPALAYWLGRYGVATTVVEKAKSLRGGGYPIDIRGTAIDVVERMDLLEQIRARQFHPTQTTFLDGDGRVLGKVSGADITGAEAGRDLEIRRGDLGDILYEATRDFVDYRFNNEISNLRQHDEGVEVGFADGSRHDFDLVIGADGLHSNTRTLAYGDLDGIEKYIGYCFSGFTIRDLSLLDNGTMVFNAPGKLAALVLSKGDDFATCLMAFKYASSPFNEKLTDRQKRELTASMFDGMGWRIPEFVECMWRSDDLFFDSMSQIHMPSWSTGRVALVGDAAHATSFLSGQGSSMALVSAYMLAGEIATNNSFSDAFARYESRTRWFVESNQALVSEGERIMIPSTPEALEQRNQGLKAFLSAPDPEKRPGGSAHDIHAALTLPDFDL